MASHLDLGSFLKEQASEGALDSHGQFTIAQDKASHKLAAFTLPRPSAWVSKLIQAAVGWNCHQVNITQTSTESLFHFTFPNPLLLPQEDDIVSHLLKARIGEHSPLDNFCLALRALVEHAKLSFLLVANDGVSLRPIYAGNHYSQLSEQERLSPRFAPQLGLCLTVYHRSELQEVATLADLIARFRGTVSIISELDEYCFTSPIPIKLDGRRIDSMVNSQALGFSTKVRPLAFIGSNSKPLQSPSVLPLPADFEAKKPSLIDPPPRLARTYSGKRHFPSVAILKVQTAPMAATLGPYRQSHIGWIQDGVLIEKQWLDVSTRRTSLLILANGAGLKTDLTGFSLLRNELFQLREQEVLWHIAQEFDPKLLLKADLFSPSIDAFSSSDVTYTRQEAVRQRTKTIIHGVGIGLGLTLVNPLIGLPATVIAAVAPFGLKQPSQEQEILNIKTVLTKAISADIAALKSFLISGPKG